MYSLAVSDPFYLLFLIVSNIMGMAHLKTGADFPQRFFGFHLLTLIPSLLHASLSLCRSIDQTAHFHILRLCKLKISTLTSIVLLAE